METLSINSLLLEIDSGHHPQWSNSPKTSKIIMDEVERSGKHVARFSVLQIRALLIGVFFYVGWHVLEMYLRQGSSS